MLTRRNLLAALIVAATAAFAGIEKGQHSEAEAREGAHSIEKRHAEEPPAHAESGEGERREAEERQAAAAQPAAKPGSEEAGAHSQEEEEELFGIDLESTPLVVLAVVASLALAAAAWLRPRWALLLVAVGAAMLVFAALDVREVLHQIDENSTGLAVLAGLVALLHLTAALVAADMARGAPLRTY